MVLEELGRFCFMALTDAAMIPALFIMKRNYRHFELFIGVFQLSISFIFNCAEAFNAHLFLRELQWHFISDILSITYFLLLCVHLMGFRDEDINIILRYIAFACSWLMKAKDGWDSTRYEMLLVGSYIMGVLYRRSLSGDKSIAPLRVDYVKYACIYLLIGAISGAIPVYFSNDLGLFAWFLKALMHLSGGAAFYYTWLAAPCLDKKSDDIFIPSYSSYA